MGWQAYVVSALRQLRYPARRIEVSVDDGPYQRFRARTVVIGNVGLLQAGIPLLPDARIDDGLLDVVVIAPQRLVGWLRVVVRVLRRGRHTDDRLARMTGTQVVVDRRYVLAAAGLLAAEHPEAATGVARTLLAAERIMPPAG